MKAFHLFVLISFFSISCNYESVDEPEEETESICEFEDGLHFATVKKRFKLHKQWMTRSYIITLAFVISGLALKLPFVQELGSFADISLSFFWMGWAVPLYVYELLQSDKRKGKTRYLYHL